MQILSGLILLAVLIVFHELGHFLFAKLLGVKVLVFSLGFGPKILGFKRGDTEYRLSAIPLGGYVRMFGESVEEDLSPEEKRISFIHQAIWRKSLIAFAGPLFNFILPILLFFGLLVGVEQVYAPIVGTILKDGTAQKAGILPDDRIEAVDGNAVQTFTNLAQLIANSPDKNLRLSIARPKADGGSEQLDLNITPEAKPAGDPFDKNKLVGRIGIMPAIEKAIVVVDPGSLLHEAGLNNFDEISAINGKAIKSMHALEIALNELKPGDHITIESPVKHSFLVPKNKLALLKAKTAQVINKLPEKTELSEQDQKILNESQELLREERQRQLDHWGLASALGVVTKVEPLSQAFNLGITEGDRLVIINGEKISSGHHLEQNLMQDIKATKIIALIKNNGESIVHIFRMPEQENNIKLDADLASTFGVSLAEVFIPGEVFERRVGVFEALKRACAQTYSIAAMTGQSLWFLISGKVPMSQLGGPIMIFDVAQQAAHKGLSYYIFIMCLMSVNLGLLNLLPIPALDGGHLLLFGIEAVQRKPLTPKTRTIATQIGFAILLALMGVAIFNDLYRLFN